MAGFDEMSKQQLKDVSQKGARAKAEAQRNKNKSFGDIVEEEMNYKTLKEIYNGLVASGKKGNVKAVEVLLSYMKEKQVEEAKESKFKLQHR